MPCYHPKRVLQRLDAEQLPTGSPEKKLRFLTSYGDSVYVKDRYLGEWNDLRNRTEEVNKYFEIPCGKCLGCRLDYSRDWTTRNILESRQWSDNYFLTLTYDDEYLPIYSVPFKDLNSGEIDERYVMSLIPEDLTKFMKALRQKLSQKFHHDGVRFFACGEYGSQTMRPHFHILVYNCPIPDLTYYKGIGEETYYNSKFIDDCWQKGFCVIGQVTAESAAYVSRYVLKKVDSDIDYKLLGMVPEFLRMSRRPGIGESFFDLQKDKIYKNDEIWLSDKNMVSYKVKPPSYFDRKFKEIFPDEFKVIKDKRLDLAKSSQAAKLVRTDIKDWDMYLSICERNKISEIRSLQRGL